MAEPLLASIQSGCIAAAAAPNTSADQAQKDSTNADNTEPILTLHVHERIMAESPLASCCCDCGCIAAATAPHTSADKAQKQTTGNQEASTYMSGSWRNHLSRPAVATAAVSQRRQRPAAPAEYCTLAAGSLSAGCGCWAWGTVTASPHSVAESRAKTWATRASRCCLECVSAKAFRTWSVSGESANTCASGYECPRSSIGRDYGQIPFAMRACTGGACE